MITLKPLTAKNLERVRVWRNQNRQFFLDTRSINKTQQKNWYKKYKAQTQEILYVVYLKKVPIGTIGINLSNPQSPSMDRLMLGNRDYAKQGLMSQAVKALVKKHPAPLYTGVVRKDNPRILKFDQKNGFTVVGEDHNNYYLEKIGPISNRFLPLLQPNCSSQEIAAVKKVLKSGWWGQGPVTQDFENQFAAFVGVPYAIATNSATSALHLAVHMLKKRFPKKTNLVVPSLTFISTAAVGVYENLEIRFADVDETTLCLDPADVAKKVDDKTLCIIPVHYAGNLALTSIKTVQESKTLSEQSCRRVDFVTQGSQGTPQRSRVEQKTYVERQSEIPIIEDCAHAAGTPGAGTTGLMSCWSFHPVKNIACGDGGMITTCDADLAAEAKRLRWLGIDQDTWARTTHSYNWEYTIPELGYKYHLNDIQSAIALTQLKRLPVLNAKRARLAARYTKKLEGLPLQLPPPSGSWHMYVTRIGRKLRNPFIDFMRAHHISVGVHYKPLHLYPVFKSEKISLPITDKVWPTLVDLPIYPHLTIPEQDYIISVIHHFFKQHLASKI